MKKINRVLVTALISTMAVTPIFASAISLRINNQLVMPVVAPFEQSGTTLVPLRIVSENLGAKVDWNPEKKTITINQKETTLILTVGSKVAKVNGAMKQLSQAPVVKHNTTMVPIRFVSENLNCGVVWDKETQTVSVNAAGVVYEESKGEKVTTIKNPKVINGVVYLTETQLKEAFGVAISEKQGFVVTITRQDFVAWLYTEERLKQTYNRMNWAYIPRTGNKDDALVIQSGTYYYPVKYLAQYLNSDISFSNQVLTIHNKGIKFYETNDAAVNTLSGYVYLPNGKPAAGAMVGIRGAKALEPMREDVQADNNGYYEIKDVDTSKYPVVNISAHSVVNGKKYITEGMPEILTKKEMKVADFKDGIPSNVTTVPDLLLLDESIWD